MGDGFVLDEDSYRHYVFCYHEPLRMISQHPVLKANLTMLFEEFITAQRYEDQAITPRVVTPKPDL